jgi:hypothetical protein
MVKLGCCRFVSRVVGFFAGYLIRTTRLLNGDELKRVLVIFILFLFSMLLDDLRTSRFKPYILLIVLRTNTMGWRIIRAGSVFASFVIF